MKNNFLLFIIILFTNSVSAKEIAYCPEKIHCAEAGKPESCTLIGGTPQYWAELTPNNNIQINDYYYVGSTMIKLSENMVGTCGYETRPTNTKALSFASKEGISLTVAENMPSNWEHPVQRLFTCKAKNSSLECPMEIR